MIKSIYNKETFQRLQQFHAGQKAYLHGKPYDKNKSISWRAGWLDMKTYGNISNLAR